MVIGADAYLKSRAEVRREAPEIFQGTPNFVLCYVRNVLRVLECKLEDVDATA